MKTIQKRNSFFSPNIRNSSKHLNLNIKHIKKIVCVHENNTMYMKTIQKRNSFFFTEHTKIRETLEFNYMHSKLSMSCHP